MKYMKIMKKKIEFFIINMDLIEIIYIFLLNLENHHQKL